MPPLDDEFEGEEGNRPETLPPLPAPNYVVRGPNLGGTATRDGQVTKYNPSPYEGPPVLTLPTTRQWSSTAPEVAALTNPAQPATGGVQWSPDPTQRQQQVRDEIGARRLAAIQQAHPYMPTSEQQRLAAQPVPHEDRAFGAAAEDQFQYQQQLRHQQGVQDALTQRQQAVAQRRFQVAQTHETNSKTLADFYTRGVKHYVDPANGLIVPMKDADGREQFTPADLGPSTNPATGLPSLARRNQQGVIEHRLPPLKLNPADPNDPYLYADFSAHGIADSPQAMKIEDAAQSSDMKLRALGLRGLKEKNTATRRASTLQALNDKRQVDLGIETAKNEAEQLNATLADPAKVKQMNAPDLAAAQARQQELAQSFSPKGGLIEGSPLHIQQQNAQLGLNVHQAMVKRDAYADQEHVLRAQIASEGGDPETDPRLEDNQRNLAQFNAVLADATKQRDRYTTLIAPRLQAQKLVGAEEAPSAAGVLALDKQGSDIAATLADPNANNLDSKVRDRLAEQKNIIDARKVAAYAKLPVEEQRKVDDLTREPTVGDVLTGAAKSLAGAAAEGGAQVLKGALVAASVLPSPFPQAGNATPEEKLEQIKSGPAYQLGSFIQDAAAETYKKTSHEDASLISKGINAAAEAAGGFAPLIASGPLAPATVGLQTAGAEVGNIYDQAISRGLTPDRAADFAVKRALASGATQAAIFEFLPKPLKNAVDKGIADRVAKGALTKFITNRVAQAAEGAVIGGGAKAASNIAAGQPVSEGVVPAAAGLALAQGALPRSAPEGTPPAAPGTPATVPATPPPADSAAARFEAAATAAENETAAPAAPRAATPTPIGAGLVRDAGGAVRRPTIAEALQARKVDEALALGEEGLTKSAIQSARVLEKANTGKSAAESSQVFEAADHADAQQEGAAQKAVDDIQQASGRPREEILATRKNADGTSKDAAQWTQELQKEAEYQKSPLTVDPERRAAELREDIAKIDREWDAHREQLARKVTTTENRAQVDSDTQAKRDELQGRRDAIETQLAEADAAKSKADTEAERVRQSAAGGEALKNDLAAQTPDTPPEEPPAAPAVTTPPSPEPPAVSGNITPKVSEAEAPVDIGQRNPEVSAGNGVPTEKEKAMLAEQQKLVDEHLAQQKAAPNNPGTAVLNAVREAQQIQGDFLKEKGISRAEAARLKPAQRKALQDEYANWLAKREAATTKKSSNAPQEQSPSPLPVRNAPEAGEGVRGENPVDQGPSGAREENASVVSEAIKPPQIKETPEYLDRNKPVSSQVKSGDIAHGYFFDGRSNEQVIGRVIRASKDAIMVEAPDGRKLKLSSNLGVFKGDGEQQAKTWLEYAKQNPEETRAQPPRPGRETITPTNDKIVGKNDAGETLRERDDGSRYRMDRDNRPNFGGDLAPVEEVPAKPTPPDAAPISADTPPPTPESVAGEPLSKGWHAFSPESGSLGIPRAEMPQVKSEARGALVNFLKARGITAKAQMIMPDQLRPTQAEFSPQKVQDARERTGSERPIIISSDGHVVDGHHQWLANLDDTQTPMPVIKLNAPIDKVLAEMKEFPSSENAKGASSATVEKAEATPAATPKLGDRAIEALQKAKKDLIDPRSTVGGGLTGPALAARNAYVQAHNAAIDLAVLAIKAGRKIADVTKMAIDRFKAKFPDATDDDVTRFSGELQTHFQQEQQQQSGPEAPETTGIAHRVSEAAGMAAERGEGLNIKEALDTARKAYTPKKALDAVKDFEDDPAKGVSRELLSAVRVHEEALSRATNAAADKNGVQSPEYQAARKAEQDWIARIKPIQTEWAAQGRLQQGETEIDTGTFHGLARAFRESTGRDLSPDEEKQAKKISTTVKGAQDAAEDAQKKVMEAAGVPRKTSAESVNAAEDVINGVTPGTPGKPAQWTPVQAKALWHVAKANYLDKGITDPHKIRTGLATDYGLSKDDIFNGLATPKGARQVTNEMYAKLAERRRVINEAKRWLAEKKYPGYENFFRQIPNAFFNLATFGHGTVWTITHTGNQYLLPKAAPELFKSLGRSFKLMGLRDNGAYHERMMGDLVNDPNFITAKRAGLANDPYSYQDDYQNPGVVKQFKKIGLMGNRGFDGLKMFRQYRFNQEWNSMPASMKTAEGAKLLADSLNKATGVTKTGKSNPLVNAAFFAPKLVASQFKHLFTDTGRSVKNLVLDRNTASPEALHAARRDLGTKALQVGTLMGSLALNNALLSASGDDERVNMTNPRAPDFLHYKGFGYQASPVSPYLSVIHALGKISHDLWGEQSNLERVQHPVAGSAAAEDAWEFARNKLSPFGGVLVDAASQSDAVGRPMPWSDRALGYRAKELGYKTKYGVGEYLSEKTLPIPAEDFFREHWRSQGATEDQINHWMRALAMGINAGATGLHVTPQTPGYQPKGSKAAPAGSATEPVRLARPR